MRITLIHGTDIEASQKRFYKILDAIKKRDWDIVTVEKSLSTIPEQLTANSLFEKQRLFVINDFDLVNKKDLEWLLKNHNRIETNLLIFKDGDVTKSVLGKLGKDIKVEQFSLPKILFVYLDSIYPGNHKKALHMFHALLVNEPAELVIAMMGTHLRDLLWVKVAPESFAGPSWRKEKLLRQANKFGEEKLKIFIEKMAQIDLKVKTSQANLTDSIDFLLTTELQ